MKIRYKGQVMNFSNYISMRCVEEKIKYLEKNYLSFDKHLREEAQKRG